MSFKQTRPEIKRLIASNLEAAVQVLNESEVVEDVYGVALCQTGDFLEGMHLMANTVENLEHRLANEPLAGRNYYELHVAEWGWVEARSFDPMRDYIEQRSELFGHDDNGFEYIDDPHIPWFVDIFREVLENAQLRTKVKSRHAETMYVGYGYADCGKDPHIVRVAEALNGPEWVEKVRDVFE